VCDVGTAVSIRIRAAHVSKRFGVWTNAQAVVEVSAKTRPTDICLLTEQISAHKVGTMKRKPGTLLPIEVSLLRAGINLLTHGTPEFHGYAVAKEMKEAEAARQLTAHGTLYRALDRMEEAGLVESRWEEQSPDTAGRPRRRLYQVTALGESAFEAANVVSPAKQEILRQGLATS